MLTGMGIGGFLGIVSSMTISGLSKGWWDAAVELEGRKAAATPPIEEEKDAAIEDEKDVAAGWF